MIITILFVSFSSFSEEFQTLLSVKHSAPHDSRKLKVKLFIVEFLYVRDKI